MVLVEGGVCQVSRCHHRCAQCSLPSDCQGGTAANSSQQQQHHQHQNRSWPHRATPHTARLFRGAVAVSSNCGGRML